MKCMQEYVAYFQEIIFFIHLKLRERKKNMNNTLYNNCIKMAQIQLTSVFSFTKNQLDRLRTCNDPTKKD